MTNAFGLFEFHPALGKTRVGADRGVAFVSIDAALAHFGDKLVYSEISEDGEAADIFVNVGIDGAIFAVERI